MLRTAQLLPLYRAFDTGLRPDPFPDRAASLLPGLLAATRTGLPPASDDELTTTDEPPTRSTSCLLGARENLTGEPDARKSGTSGSGRGRRKRARQTGTSSAAYFTSRRDLWEPGAEMPPATRPWGF